MNTPNSDIYPSTNFLNPLLKAIYMTTEDPVSIDVQARDDWLLSTFVNTLDNEIVDDIEEFKEYTRLIVKIMDYTRIHGWCVVQLYAGLNEFGEPDYRVSSSKEWSKWLTNKNEETNTLERIGCEISWNDDLGNVWKDELYFEDQVQEQDITEVKTLNQGKDKGNANKPLIGKAHLFIWQKSDGRTKPFHPQLSSFVIADVNTAILGLSMSARQLLHTITHCGTNPFFYHMIYGENITPPQRSALVSQMSLVNVSAALGAKRTVLEEIVSVENSAVDESIAAFNTIIGAFASKTRLPASYYFGEKQIGSGLDSGGAEEQDEIKIMKKKEFVLQHFLKPLGELLNKDFSSLYDYYSNEMEEQEKKKEELENNQNNEDKENNPKEKDNNG